MPSGQFTDARRSAVTLAHIFILIDVGANPTVFSSIILTTMI
jgi:hypothetical protein